MPFEIVRNDITKMTVDAIVNPTDTNFSGSGGVDAAIHKTAGRRLRKECDRLNGCGVGECKATEGYKLPCKYIIHTASPVWQDGKNGEEILLKSCYTAALAMAAELGCKTVAVPLISSGSYGYPKEKALQAAREAIESFLAEHELKVSLVVFDKQSYVISKELYSDIASFISNSYVKNRTVQFSRALPMAAKRVEEPLGEYCAAAMALEDVIKNKDESFSQMLLRKIDEKGMTDAECYKKANIDRKLFSKIRGDVHYRPSKPTAIAFAIALELSLAETKDMLLKAGYALSRSNEFDIIIEYFIGRGNYNVFEINEALFAFDQSLLGA